MTQTKGQAAVEGFMTLAVIMFLYTMLVLMTISRDADMGTKTDIMDRMDVCLAVQSSVAAVLAGGDGTSLTFDLVSKDDIYVSGRYAEVGSENYYSCVLPASVSPATITSGTIQVSNSGGVTIQNV